MQFEFSLRLQTSLALQDYNDSPFVFHESVHVTGLHNSMRPPGPSSLQGMLPAIVRNCFDKCESIPRVASPSPKQNDSDTKIYINQSLYRREAACRMTCLLGKRKPGARAGLLSRMRDGSAGRLPCDVAQGPTLSASVESTTPSDRRLRIYPSCRDRQTSRVRQSWRTACRPCRDPR